MVAQPCMHEIIVGGWDIEKAPAEWKQALIVPAFKSGDASLLDNSRGINLLSIPGKVYSLVMVNASRHGMISSYWMLKVGSCPQGAAMMLYLVLDDCLKKLSKDTATYACAYRPMQSV